MPIVQLPLEAVLLVGGQGVRLRSVVSDRPKPMAEVAGRPFVEWLILALRAQGVKRVVLCTGYQADQLEAHFGDGSAWNMELEFSRESEPLGTGGAVRYALPHVRSTPFLILNGDSYCSLDLAKLQEEHAASRAQVTLWLVWVEDCRRYGMVEMDSAGAVQAFREKSPESQGGWINAGVYLFDRKVAEQIPIGQKVSLETEVFPALIGKGLCAVRGEGPFVDIGLPEALRAAQEMEEWRRLA